ncbi:hypothetical protein [Pseudoxanthomonas sp. JBR18]|uniref:hypothetical protein n=1 Tax=Pseudoxanthomonas sp. JBR18 TaxID=2969308 RepID=UPI00230550F4|nr:hypothetical protein [Pseudoxanthomonas sp. JBR18]WCE04427.1 hypothetical protein PJ250_20575 [Pseudoxanthomonas sp. JBR18]
MDIINLAIGKLAQDVGIAAVTDQSKAARVFGRLWDPMSDLVLVERNWPWALKAQLGALAGDAPLPGWQWRYSTPSDCLRVVAVTDEQGMRATRRMSIWCDQQASAQYAYEFERSYGESSTSIQTDLEKAWLIYICRVSDTERFPPHFVDALACKLAEEAAPPMIGDRGMNAKPNLKQLYQTALSEAAAVEFNQAEQNVRPMTESLAARA